LLNSIHKPIRYFPSTQTVVTALHWGAWSGSQPSGKAVDWMEKVSDEEYAAAARLHPQEEK
jgi:hypothetical protein